MKRKRLKPPKERKALRRKLPEKPKKIKREGSSNG